MSNESSACLPEHNTGTFCIIYHADSAKKYATNTLHRGTEGMILEREEHFFSI